MTKIYTSEELTNEQYRELPHICGTDIVTLMSQSPHKWRNAKRKRTDALGFGVAAHVMLLEPSVFDERFAVEPDVIDAMKTVTELKAHAKDLGIKIKSTASKTEIIQSILEADESAMIADEILSNFAEENAGKTILKRDDYNKMSAMRDAVMSKKRIAELLAGGVTEISITTEIDGIPVKIRPDLITKNGGIIDYKTTRDCSPDRFINDAFKSGYFAKMAFQCDVFTAAYGRAPAFVALLPQDKDDGYETAVHECYLLVLTAEQLEIGRIQYQPILRLAHDCIKNDNYPSYADDEIIEIDTPPWIKRQFFEN